MSADVVTCLLHGQIFGHLEFQFPAKALSSNEFSKKKTITTKLLSFPSNYTETRYTEKTDQF
jgi:hypothetical protein